MISPRAGLVVGALISGFGGGYYLADLRADVVAAELAEQHEQSVRDAQSRVEAVERELAEAAAQVVYKQKVVTRDVIKYVQNPDRTVCVFDDDRMRIKQSILQAVDPRAVTGGRAVPVGREAGRE